MIGCSPRQLLQRLGVGRVAGLGLLLGREAELVEEDLPQLRGGVDEELGPRQLLDLLLEPARLHGQLAGQAAQPVDVDADAGVLHPGQHLYQRPLDLVVERDMPRAARAALSGSTSRATAAARRAASPPGSAALPVRSSWPAGGASGARSSTPA